jgi:phospholipase C
MLMVNRLARRLTVAFVLIGPVAGSVLAGNGGLAAQPASADGPRISHVVIIDQENHSFDNVLGLLCLQLGRCAGPTTLADGTPIGLGLTPDRTSQITIPLPKASDIVPTAPHDVQNQATAIDNGNMDGFDLMIDPVNGQNCARPNYDCYQAFQPKQIPNLAALATNFVIADHTFQSELAASWGSHLGLVAGTLDGFYGDNPCFPSPNPCGTTVPLGPGWGCDSNRDATWTSPSGQRVFVPSCVPFPDGHGTYLDSVGKKSPVSWVPTLMDRLDGAGLSWKLYAGAELDKAPSGFEASGYQWAICPTFADCLETSQKNNLALASQVIADATNGHLPAVSLVTPTLTNSQHNTVSMKKGDNWMGDVVSAIENGPNWSSTAIFITYDDCGCFYDHVAPPSGLGIRVPMVIVSPWSRRNFTDSNTASFASLLAFIEHRFELQPLGAADANAYDFSNSFDFSHPKLSTITMVTSSVPADELLYIKAHPGPADDPT